MNLDILRKRSLGKVYHSLNLNKLDKLPLIDSKPEMIILMILIIGLNLKNSV